MTTLKASKRDLSVKAKKLRRDGYVTGNLLRHQESLPLLFFRPDAYRFIKENKEAASYSGYGGRENQRHTENCRLQLPWTSRFWL